MLAGSGVLLPEAHDHDARVASTVAIRIAAAAASPHTSAPLRTPPRASALLRTSADRRGADFPPTRNGEAHFTIRFAIPFTIPGPAPNFSAPPRIAAEPRGAVVPPHHPILFRAPSGQCARTSAPSFRSGTISLPASSGEDHIVT
jgi:hypothetical protein